MRKPWSLNGNRITLDRYESLPELIWVKRAEKKCGCCMEWDLQENGERDHRCGYCHRWNVEEKGEVSFEEMGEGEMGKFWSKVERETKIVFEANRRRKGKWRDPKLRIVKLLRDGVLC